MVEFQKKKNWPPNPPLYTLVQPLGHDTGDLMKISSDMFYIFHLWEDTPSLVLKIFEIDSVIEIYWYLIIFDLLTPPQGHRGRRQKNVPLQAPFMWATYTPNLVGFSTMV